MKKACYIEYECEEGTNVEGGCLIVDRNTLYIKMMSPYEVPNRIDIDLDRQHLTETEDGEDELFDYAATVLGEMYRTIKLIEREPAMFRRLYVNFENLIGGQQIRFRKRVFHSETDEYYFLKHMDEVIYESYFILFDKYITTTDKDILGLRNTLTPLFFRQVMRKVFHADSPQP